MKRWIAILLLAVMGSFMAASSQDHCHDGGQSAPPPHILCVDDCAPAVIPVAPCPPPQDPLPEPAYAAPAADPIPVRDLEPETAPPRA